MALSPRRRARELVLKGLYAWDVGVTDAGEVKRTIITDDSLSSQTLQFAHTLFSLVCDNHDWADRVISSLAENWDIERVAKIDRNILRMGLVELKEMPDVPIKVVLNEAIELAKKYSTGESSAFINGILDSFVKKLPK